MSNGYFLDRSRCMSRYLSIPPGLLDGDKCSMLQKVGVCKTIFRHFWQTARSRSRERWTGSSWQAHSRMAVRISSGIILIGGRYSLGISSIGEVPLAGDEVWGPASPEMNEGVESLSGLCQKSWYANQHWETRVRTFGSKAKSCLRRPSQSF